MGLTVSGFHIIDYIMRRILFFVIWATVLFTEGCTHRTSEERSFEFRDSVYVQYISYAGVFYDCSFVDWDAMADLNLFQYNSDWGPEINEIMHPSWHGHDAASLYWDRLQSAKMCLHVQSLPLRAISNKRVLRELDSLEETFDRAFVEMVSQEYYLRVFQDVFDEMIPAKVDEMAAVLSRNRYR